MEINILIFPSKIPINRRVVLGALKKKKTSFLFFVSLFLYRLPCVFVVECRLSLVVASMGYCLLAVHRLLIAMALLVKHALQACRLSSCSTRVQ